jgi:hypothetical protein
MFDAEISRLQSPSSSSPSSSSSSAAWGSPTSTICEHSFLFLSEFFLLYYPMAGKSPRWEVGDMVLFERWQNPSNLLGETLFADHLQTTWSRKASTSIVLLTELYTSENAINFGCPSAHFPLSSIPCPDLVIFPVRVESLLHRLPHNDE